ncbi:DUF4303 domain-containing protein [Streptomyces sp. PKU-MA01144]|uniref:DUF4303 domain-containing protein n=1 Tax=Streptomyces sp. PKU-MA01144 TaxID=2729138 RepID=UPI0028116863|nr:DUF4303 domain-containing protein [Streptomyces sp. PKU-MA01144]
MRPSTTSPKPGTGRSTSGYALYSDADAMTVCLSANTRAHLASMRTTDPDDAEYYVWTPAEWALEGISHEHFDALCRKSAASSATGGATERERRREAVYEACVTALESLVEEGVFGTAGIRVVVFAVSDVADPVREVEWIRRLNPPSRSRDVWEDAVVSRS